MLVGASSISQPLYRAATTFESVAVASKTVTEARAMTHNQLVTVEFHGQSILAIMHDGKPYVAMQPICENIGLQWGSQYNRIQRSPVLKSTVFVMKMVAEDGKQREMVCLPLTMLNGWMFGVDLNRVRPELRDKLMVYQRECFDVLYRHFMPQQAPAQHTYSVQPSDTLSEPQQIALRAMLESNVKRLPHAQQAGAMVKGWSKLKAHFGVPYRQIPASEFTEAISIVARHVSEWEVLEAEVPHSPAQNLPCVHAAMQAATQAGAQVQQAVFEAVLAGNEQWKFGRWLLSFVTDSKLAAPAIIQRVGNDEFVTSTRQLIDCINDPGFLLSNTELAGLAQACTNRLARRFAGGTGPSAA